MRLWKCPLLEDRRDKVGAWHPIATLGTDSEFDWVRGKFEVSLNFHFIKQLGKVNSGGATNCGSERNRYLRSSWVATRGQCSLASS